MWRGGLSERRIAPFGCAAVVKPFTAIFLADDVASLGAASQPNGGKPPRHNGLKPTGYNIRSRPTVVLIHALNRRHQFPGSLVNVCSLPLSSVTQTSWPFSSFTS